MTERLLQSIERKLDDMAAKMVTKEDLLDMVTKEDLLDMATKEDLLDMATKMDLLGMATKKDVADMVAKMADMTTQMATKEDFAAMVDALKSELLEAIKNEKGNARR